MKLPSLRLPSWRKTTSDLPVYDDEDEADLRDEDVEDIAPPRGPANVERLLLISAWAVTLAVMLGVVLWLILARDTIMAELEAQQPQMRMSVANALARSAAAPDAAQRPSAVPLTAPGAISGVPVPATGQAVALHPHPDPALIEQGEMGPLPQIDAAGRQPWHVYARPFDQLDQRPRIAIVLTGMGVSAVATESAIRELPGAVTLAFQPFARDVGIWIDRARADGHEVLINLPMEPIGFPRNDPGPYALMTTLNQEENMRRLDWVLSRMTGYVGALNFMGSRFTADEAATRSVLAVLHRRGLMILDARETPLSTVPRVAQATGMPFAVADSLIDAATTRAAIDERLAALEARAANDGTAVGMARAFPVTLERLKRWAETLPDKGFTLAPLSAVAIAPEH